MALDKLPKGTTQLFTQRDVRETATSALVVADIAAPVGSIVAWLKSFTGTPATLPVGWVECDGSVLNDAESVYDGETLPDLNGGEFLRGFTTSGGTGGSETMAHTHTGTTDGHTHTGSASGPSGTTSSDGGTGGPNVATATHVHNSVTVNSNTDTFTSDGASNTENRPPFYNVVWIMRIK